MVEEIITIFCICDDLLKEIHYSEDKQVEMTTSEILTLALVAAKFFGGSFEQARFFLKEHGYMPKMLSKSRINRRIHGIDDDVWRLLFSILSKGFKETNQNNEYAIDSFPVPVCSNVRIKRCKIYKSKAYNGFAASKKVFFYGIRVHMVVTSRGQPVEFILRPGSEHDIKAAKLFTLNLFNNAKVYADKGYTDYKFEDYLKKERNIYLIPQRKINAKRSSLMYQRKKRKIIETAFSLITRKFPKRIHAVTAKGFELKVVIFIFAYLFTFF